MKKILAALFAALALAPAAAGAQPGRPYTELQVPQQTDAGGRIDVIEFFWYGCIHCYNLEPVLEKWLKTLPPEARFRRVPAVFNERWAYDAKIFYAFEAMGVLDKVHRDFFDAIHRDRLRTNDPEALAQWLDRQGIEPKKFVDVMNSFAVQSKARRAALMTAAYRIEGTPQMAVDGRYTVSAEQGGSPQGMLDIVSRLVEQLRKSK